MRYEVLGVPVDALSLADAADRIESWARTGRRGYVCVTGVHGIMESRRSDAVRRAHADADLVVPDGMPLVWCGRRLGLEVTRVYGPTLMLQLLGRDTAKRRHALYGSTPETLDLLRANLTRQLPALDVVAAIAPPFGDLTSPANEPDIAALNDAKPDVVWVGLSTPKQELWMHRWRPQLEATALIGVGAAFDFHAGRVKQAPAVLQRNGLEWAYRLTQEPRRLWRRYLRNNPAFALAIAMHPPRVLGNDG